ncbi:hypothetical protein Syun_022764 [Stephania yunnanensis]|uniref:Uncharacterized protein n=1 Tax=Stephania yunnanensis TaxID=152371 RepID=A0AAP0HYV5_9MAGN
MVCVMRVYGVVRVLDIASLIISPSFIYKSKTKKKKKSLISLSLQILFSLPLIFLLHFPQLYFIIKLVSPSPISPPTILVVLASPPPTSAIFYSKVNGCCCENFWRNLEAFNFECADDIAIVVIVVVVLSCKKK